MSNAICIYHGNCADGFASATVVRTAKLGLQKIDFYPGVYGEDPPDVSGMDVILVDFSYKRPVLIDMAQQANSILILDHHKSAEAELVDLPDNVACNFDMSKSGCVMAWDYYNPGEEPPQILLHIQDRDLWEFKLDGTREIQACIFSYPYNFDVWGDLFYADLDRLRSDGAAIERKNFKDINELIMAASYISELDGNEVPMLNCPYFYSSDAGRIMGENNPFAACFYDTGAHRVFSLRSASNGMDVSTIAAKYGGGGHKHAAGFRWPLNDLDALR